VTSRSRSCARPCGSGFRTTWCRPPSSSWRRSPSPRAARWTARRCRLRKRTAGKRTTWPRAPRPSRSSPGSGPSCSVSTGWEPPTPSSTSEATRCWRPA